MSVRDNIVVIKDGMITERGKHSDLMKLDGEYSNLITTFYTQDSEDHKKCKEGMINQ